MAKIGEREAQLRALREIKFLRKPSKEVVPNHREASADRSQGNNKTPPPARPRKPGAGLAVQTKSKCKPDTSPKMISTRNRVAYNAYQREYQKKRRAKLRGKSL